MQEQLSIRLKFNETDILLLMSTIWWIFSFFIFIFISFGGLVLYYYWILSISRGTYRRRDWAREVVAIRCSRTWRPCHLNAVPSGRYTSFSNPFPRYRVQPGDRWTVVRRSLSSRCLQRTLGRKTPIVAYLFFLFFFGVLKKENPKKLVLFRDEIRSIVLT